jgi:hypothetical protein
MPIRRSVQLNVFVALALLIGCARICDQRITLRYDEQADTLYVLIHYDGVHDSGSDQWGKGAEQLARFIDQGEIMLLDWPWHLPMADIRKQVQDAMLPAEERAFLQAIVDHVQVEAIGRYRDALGRVGGAQLVTINKASELVNTINDSINAGIRRTKLEGIFPPYDELIGTRERILAAAGKNHAWLAIDGHALQFNVPMHEQEWAVLKANGIYSFLMEVHKGYPADDEEHTRKTFATMGRSLANVPFAYSETAGLVTLRLGDPAQPATIRLAGLNEYAPNLEPELARLVAKEIEPLIARRVNGENIEPESAGLTALVEWGPPEERVRAMARAAESGDATLANAAYAWLTRFRDDWNRNRKLPKMPAAKEPENRAEFIQACLKWCRELREFPNPLAGEAADQ